MLDFTERFFLPITIAKLFSGLIQMLPMFFINVIGVLIFVPVVGGVILRCFYIPHILSGILITASTLRIVRDIRRKELRAKELILLLISIAICVLNLYALDQVFTAAMSV